MSEACIRHPGWRVVTACFAMTFIGFGFGFYGHSVYLAALTIRDGTDAPSIGISTVSTAITIYYLAAAAIMVFVSDLIVRLGPRLFAAIGAVMMGLSLVLIARIRSVGDLFVAYLVMAPAFAMLTNAAVANTVALWFTEKRGLALSIALTGRGWWTGHCSRAGVAEQQVVVCDCIGGSRCNHHSRSLAGNRALHSRSHLG